MDEQKLKEFQKDLEILCTDYCIKSASFCGEANGHYIGMLDIGHESTQQTAFDAVLSIGRLWQHGREQVRHLLNSYERKW